jgi:linoleoyl-CoA desaturase
MFNKPSFNFYMSTYQSIKFSNKDRNFYRTLSKRVNDYFKDNNIDKYANTEMKVKTAVMLGSYFAIYFLIISGVFTNIWALWTLSAVLGLSIGGIGLSVMHDACHGAYSSNPTVNSIFAYTLNLMGANAFNWKVQHNFLHHTFTNVHDADEDVSQRGIFRLNPNAKWIPLHKYQHIYGWFFYGLMTISWVIAKDFIRINVYRKNGLIERLNGNLVKEYIILVLTKVVYFAYVIVLPSILLPVAWWQVLIGFFTAHFVAGFILAIIFQPAHVIEETIFPMPDGEGEIENNWAIHQLLTTTNFAPNNHIFSWYVGGLNFQVEHHLFPGICHVHYKNIAPIVKQTAEEFGVPYYSTPTFTEAVLKHAKTLKKFGQKPSVLEEKELLQPA